MFAEPIFEKNHYVLKSKNTILQDIIDVNLKGFYNLKNTGCFINCYLNNKDKIFFENIDKKSINELVINNSKWFNNNLLESEIINMFRPVFCSQNNIISFYITDNIPIYLDDKNISLEKFKELCQDIPKFKKNFLINIKAKYNSMNVYHDFTQNKWNCADIYVYSNEETDIDNNEEILDYWKQMIEESHKVLNIKISVIEELKEQINSKYNELKISCEETKIKELKDLIQNIIF